MEIRVKARVKPALGPPARHFQPLGFLLSLESSLPSVISSFYTPSVTWHSLTPLPQTSKSSSLDNSKFSFQGPWSNQTWHFLPSQFPTPTYGQQLSPVRLLLSLDVWLNLPVRATSSLNTAQGCPAQLSPTQNSLPGLGEQGRDSCVLVSGRWREGAAGLEEEMQ